MPRAGSAGNHLCLLGRADRVVHAFEQEGESDPGGQTKHQSERQIARDVGFGRRGRRAGNIDEANVVGSQPGSDSRFFQFLEQALIQLAIDVHVTLQQAVLDGVLIELVGFLLLLLELHRATCSPAAEAARYWPRTRSATFFSSG